jgi:hypothetical protein
MALNVPAVYDVLAARIRALRSIVPQERDQSARDAYWRRSVNSLVDTVELIPNQSNNRYI